MKHEDQIEIEIIAQNNSSENFRELSIDFFNSLSTDINIEGIDDISHGKQETNKDKFIKRYRQYIFFLVAYAVALTIAAFITRTRPDFSYQLLIQSDSTYVDSALSIFSKENMVEIDSLKEKLLIDEFNKNYVIKGIPLDLPKRNHYSFIFDVSLAAFFYLSAVVFYIRYRQRKKKYFDYNK